MTPEQTIETITVMGVTKHIAELTVEMYGAVDSGNVKDEFPRTDTIIPTTPEEFSRTYLVPAIKG